MQWLSSKYQKLYGVYADKGSLYSWKPVINLEETHGRARKWLKEFYIVDYHIKPTRS